MNKRGVRLAATGRHLFEAQYCYNHSLRVDDITFELVDRHWLASREPTEAERDKFLRLIERENAEQERKWDVNQPID